MKVATDTIIRTIVLAIALINQLLAACGFSPLPFDEAETTEWVSTSITILAALWAWWKNNSFTKAAIIADKELKALKQQMGAQSLKQKIDEKVNQ